MNPVTVPLEQKATATVAYSILVGVGAALGEAYAGFAVRSSSLSIAD
jgi:hypothetical protein